MNDRMVSANAVPSPTEQAASPDTQLLAFATIGVLLAGAAVVAHVGIDITVGLLGSLVAGIALGQIFDLRAWSRRVPGIVSAIVVLAAILILGLVITAPTILIAAPIAAMFVLGTDWYWADRLRVLTWLTAPVALIFAGAEPPRSIMIGVVWLIAALGTHGSVERDQARAAALRPKWGTTASNPPRPTRGLIGSIVIGVAIGLLAALLINLALLLEHPRTPSYSWQTSPGAGLGGQLPIDRDGDGRADQFGSDGSEQLSDRGADGSGQSGSGSASGSGSGQSGSGQSGSGQSGSGQSGSGQSDAASGSGSGQSDTGSGSASGQGATGTCERVRGCIAVPGNGRIVVDEAGRPLVDTNHDGTLDVHRDGRLGIDLDGDGRIDSYDTSKIIVDADADGRLRIDNNGDGRTDRTEGGSVGIDLNGDGVIDQNGTGRVGIDFDNDGRLDSTDPGWLVLPDGSPPIPTVPGTGASNADPDVVIADGVDPNGASSSGRSGANGEPSNPSRSVVPSPTTTQPHPDNDRDGSSKAWLIGLGLVALAAAFGTWLYLHLRRRAGDPADVDELASKQWARALLEQLEDEGKARGRPRRRNESVTAYAHALAHGPLPDARIIEVGRALDLELFGPFALSEHERADVHQALRDAAAAFPPGWERDTAAPPEPEPEPAGIG